MTKILTGVSPFAPGITLRTTEGNHLARRAAINYTAELGDHIDRYGYEKWLDEQLDWKNVSDDDYEQEREQLFPLYGTSWEYIRANNRQRLDRTINRIVEAYAHEQYMSKRHLRVTMINFMYDLLNVESYKVMTNLYGHVRVIREGCLGKYSDLVKAVYHERAMHQYLDNVDNKRGAKNENLGRELLELHTVGSDSGYDDVNDVISSSHVLSGCNGNNFYHRLHEMGPVQVMGWSHENNPTNEAQCWEILESLIDYLTLHEATAKRLAERLITAFISDRQKYPVLRDKLANIYLDNESDMRPVVKALFMSDEFKASVGQKVKRPQQVQASILASFNTVLEPGYKVARNLAGQVIDHKNTPEFVEFLEAANHVPAGWLYPDGYTMKSDKWLSSNYMLKVWNVLGNKIDKLDNNGKFRLDKPYASNIHPGRDRWLHATQKAFRFMTGFEMERKPSRDERHMFNLMAAIANNGGVTVPNMMRKPTDDQIRRLNIAAIHSPYIYLS